MIIKTTDKIGEGEILFPTIGYTIKKNFQLSIPEKDFYNQDIQDGISRGVLVLVMAGINEKEKAPDDMVKIVNKMSGPLSIEDISLMKNASTIVSKDRIETSNFKVAVDAGMIEVVSLTDKKVSEEKSEEKPERKTKPRPQTPKKQSKIEFVDKPEEVEKVETVDANEGSPKTNMQAWDGHEKKALDKDTAAKVFAGQHNMEIQESDNEEGIKWADGLEPDDKPRSFKVTAKKSKTTKKASKKKTAKKKTTKKASKPLEPVGERREPPIDPNASVEFINVPRPPADDLVSFVDQEQEAERIAKRPSVADQNSEVDLE